MPIEKPGVQGDVPTVRVEVHPIIVIIRSLGAVLAEDVDGARVLALIVAGQDHIPFGLEIVGQEVIGLSLGRVGVTDAYLPHFSLAGI